MYFAIEGLIGVGKSTLLNRLNAIYNCNPISQEFENHPYLAEYYKNPAENIIEKDMMFLFMSYHQLKSMNSENLLITDFTFAKSKAFAQASMPKEILEGLFLPAYSFLDSVLPRPDVILFLSASIDTIWNRIQGRGRAMEQGIRTEYLMELSRRYEDVINSVDYCPVIRYNTDAVDFRSDTSCIEALLSVVEREIPALTLYRKI